MSWMIDNLDHQDLLKVKKAICNLWHVHKIRIRAMGKDRAPKTHKTMMAKSDDMRCHGFI
jgi:hypothetical protein